MVNVLIKKHKIILVLVILLAVVLRFWKLGGYPAMNADEASIGYDAYSLIQTGKDQHGNPWPIHFQSFNDYKPGLYVYLVLPLVKFFGLNVWVVRLPNAILSVISVYVLYLLVNNLFKSREFEIWNLKFGIWPAFMLALSPWHIQFSRGGWEVNVATFFIILGLYLFIKGIKDKVFLFFSSFIFALSLYTYHATRVVVPLLVIGLLAIYFKELRKNIKSFLIAGIIGFLLFLPLAREFTRPVVASRAAGVGLFADPGPLNRINEQRGEHGDYTSLIAKLFHNKAVNYSLAFLENWGQHYWGNFLFLSGDLIQRDKVPETGQMYLIDLIFLLAGLSAIAIYWGKDKNTDRGWQVVLWWLLVAPTAAALTFQSPHALRSENMVIPLVVISAFGLVNIIIWLKSIKYLTFNIWALSLVVIWQFVLYQHNYWVHMAKQYPYSSQYGVKELVSYVENNQGEYRDVVVTTRYDQPYILFLFYMNYPPTKFQSEHVLTSRDEYGFSTVSEFGKYHFRAIDFLEVRTIYPNSLIIGTPDEIPKEANIVQRIYGTNGFEYFDVVAN